MAVQPHHPILPRTAARLASIVGCGVLGLALGVGPVAAAPGRGAGQVPVCHDCNIVFVAFDTLRADYDALVHQRDSLMPTVERLARRGVTFTQAISASSWTLPATMSWFTGVYPSRHKITNTHPVRSAGEEHAAVMSLRARPLGLVTLAEVLRGAGYRTGAFTGGAGVHHQYGFDLGFEAYFDTVNFGGLRDSVPRALDWIRAHKDERLFVFLHGYDCHERYEPEGGLTYRYVPRPYQGPYRGTIEEQNLLIEEGLEKGQVFLSPKDTAFWKGVYAEKVARADQEFARFLQAYEDLGLTEKTIFVITSDHGQEFMEHGRLGHGPTLYEEVVRVPLLLVVPGLSQPMRMDRQVRSIDLFPTLLQLTGVTGPAHLSAQLQGASLVGPDDSPRDALLETAYRYATFQTALRTAGRPAWKLIINPELGTRELFNLFRDPGERHDRQAAEPEAARDVEARLMSRFAPLTSVPQLIARHERALRATCDDCHVIFVVLDTLRADALPCYGYDRQTAPNLCGFAADHLLFTKSFSQAPFTLPSHFSLFTSLYPSSHRMLVPLRDVLRPDIVTLPQVLHANGYDTVYVGPTTHPHLPLEKGLGRGFYTVIPPGDFLSWDKGYARLLNNARHGRPTFLFLHTYAVHQPYLTGRETTRRFTTDTYPQIALAQSEFSKFTGELRSEILRGLEARIRASDTPESLQRNQDLYTALRDAKSLPEAEQVFSHMDGFEFEQWHFFMERYKHSVDANDPRQVAYLRALYDEQIYEMDKRLQILFAVLSDPSVQNNALVVITSDHGEEFFEHGELDHGRNLYNTATRVPLILAVPGLAPRRVDDLVQGIDVFPTLLGLLGMDPPPTLEGLDLTGLLLGRPEARHNDYIVAERQDEEMVAIGDTRWKLYIPAPWPIELYDYVADPLEQSNLAADHPEVVARLSKALRGIRERRGVAPRTDRPFPAWIDAIKREKLIKEGYF